MYRYNRNESYVCVSDAIRKQCMCMKSAKLMVLCMCVNMWPNVLQVVCVNLIAECIASCVCEGQQKLCTLGYTLSIS